VGNKVKNARVKRLAESNPRLPHKAAITKRLLPNEALYRDRGGGERKKREKKKKKKREKRKDEKGRRGEQGEGEDGVGGTEGGRGKGGREKRRHGGKREEGWGNRLEPSGEDEQMMEKEG